MNLLLVNDIKLETDTMIREIPWAEYHIRETYAAYTVNEAKSIIQKNHIDILLCDIEMPGENGLELVHWINKNNYDIDCILLTCHADFSYAREGLELGCRDYLLLPAKYEDIGNSVLKACNYRKQRLEEKHLQDYGKIWLKNQTDQMHQEKSSTHYTPDQIAEKCIQFILEHISDQDLSVQAIADHIYLNPMHLNRVFKREKGMNISQWITKERMELASTMLLNTDHTAIDIAQQVGYNSYPYFSTVFKKYFSCNPSQYVKQNK